MLAYSLLKYLWRVPNFKYVNLTEYQSSFAVLGLPNYLVTKVN